MSTIRRKVTFVCLSSTLCVFICLQLVSHFLMFKETQPECLCRCNEESPQDEAAQSPVEKERRFHENVNEILEFLGNMNEVQQTSFAGNYEQLLELLSDIKENRDAATHARKLSEQIIPQTETAAQAAEVQEICPEKFMGDSLTYGYPFFRKGFATVNCSQHVPIHEMISLVFDDLHASSLHPPAYKRVLKGLAKYHPKMKVVYITRDPLPGGVKDLKSNVRVVHVQKGIKQGEVWSKALSHVTTKYVLIAPNLSEFDDDINLRRLVRVLSHQPDVATVSGAYRTRNGYWDIGCQQSRNLNYTLTLHGGYYMSFWECVVCDFTPGPWLARTRELKKLKFDEM